ncbi:MAG: 6-phosphofructokinase [Verrucomicrobia bacterium]|nr:6-phosphofructokinase [Verrucomicrobiota bacterium]MDE3048048.1 6-phosphofructokinase [Verrucomicrobiota bacterium]
MAGSLLQKQRMQYKPQVPVWLSEDVCFETVGGSQAPENLRPLFPHTFETPVYRLRKGRGAARKVTIGVVFSGGQAAGGHNVIAGLFDSGAQLIGFLGGPQGIIDNQTKALLQIDAYRNQGGFDLLGSGRTKIETQEQLAASLKACTAHRLDGLVIIGGDDSNTNAALLAEYFLQHGCKTVVVGVPKTIDGDLRSSDIEISFGFDSACKTYSEIIGNIARDALSAKKYYHFIKLMGRSASHIALECALQTQPNLTLIGEERRPLKEIVRQIAELITRRAELGKNYGVVLIPEGLIEFVPELTDLPHEKDPHGNIEVSKIQTEKLIIDLVKKELGGRKWNALDHFLGYEGRSCLPTNFDANYCYALGKLAFFAVRESLTGVICSIQHLKESPQKWQFKMIPIVQLMHLEWRLGKEKPVIRKTLVDLKGSAYLKFSSQRKSWELEDLYQMPGPIQFFGDPALTDSVPISLM